MNKFDPSRTRTIVIERPGGPEVLQQQLQDLPQVAPGEVRLRQTAIGVNYHDIYVRSGLYQTLPLPGVPGIEAVGIVEEVGSAVDSLSPGDRIGYVSGAYGAYAEARNLDAALAIKLPPVLNDISAAASLMKALTVCMLIRHVHQVRSGDTILVHAAAGGVGQLLCNWASHIGAKVVGTVGSTEKAEIARRAGAHHTILYRSEDVAARVRDITDGRGVSVAYDSVGADTFEASLNSLDFCGHLVCFGQSSGPVAPFAPSLLAPRSLTVSRPIVFHYLRTRDRLEELAQPTLDAFAQGVLKPINPTVLPMSQAGEAQSLLEERLSPGGVVLVP